MTQADYEDMYTGAEFSMEYRYSNLLTVLMIVMFYGSGMPILYLIAACYYFMTYWCDKFLLFYYYRKPVNYNDYIAKKTVDWHKYALILHLIGGVLMLSNSSILPSINDDVAKSWLDYFEK